MMLATLMLMLMIAIPAAAILLIIKIVMIHSCEYEEFKDYIYRKDVEYDKLSFLRFLQLFEKYNAEFAENKSDVYCSMPSYEVYHYIYLKPYMVMLGEQKFVYFNFANYLIYFVWLHIFTKREDKKRNFVSKRKEGLFDKKVE